MMKWRSMAVWGVVSVAVFGSFGGVMLRAQEARPAAPTAKLGMKLNGGQLDLTVQSPLQMSLRSSDGRLVKGIDAKENGATVVTSFHKDGSRFYSIEDSFDGTAHLIILGSDKERVSLQINKDGSIDVKVLTDTATSLARPVLPPVTPAEPVSAPAPAQTGPETEVLKGADGTGTASILQRKKD